MYIYYIDIKMNAIYWHKALIENIDPKMNF